MHYTISVSYNDVTHMLERAINVTINDEASPTPAKPSRRHSYYYYYYRF